MIGPTVRYWHVWGEERTPEVTPGTFSLLREEVMWHMTGRYEVGQWVQLETIVAALAEERSRVRRQCDNLVAGTGEGSSGGWLEHQKDEAATFFYAVTEAGMVERGRIRCRKHRRDTHGDRIALIVKKGMRS